MDGDKKKQQEALDAATQEVQADNGKGQAPYLLALIRDLQARVEALENHITK